jgi:hypothetical protein
MGNVNLIEVNRFVQQKEVLFLSAAKPLCTAVNVPGLQGMINKHPHRG